MPRRRIERASAPPDRLFSRAHLPLALGATVLVTLGAFENRAVGTALPTLVQEFDAVSSFGIANAAPIASFVASLVFAGLWTDRSGPVPALRTGAVAFALAQIMAGAAPAMPMVVTGRLLSGLAEGLLDVGLMVLIARALPTELRPRMFALISAAWVLPSVLGPVLTGLITEYAGWRWVFWSALGFIGPTWWLLRPAIGVVRSRLSVDEPAEGGQPAGTPRAIVPWALAAAVAVFGLALAGDQLETRPVYASLVVLVCSVAVTVGAVRLLPAGTFRARRGMPTLLAMRCVTGAAFGGTGAWLPLLLTLLHGFGPSMAGVSLSITGVMWALGSWLQSRAHRALRTAILRTGLATMTAGLAVTSVLAWTTLSPYVGLVGWAIASVGMGLSSPTLAVLVLDRSDRTNQGRNNSAAQLASSLSTAVALAISGAAVAFAAPNPGRLVFATILTGGAAVALLGTLISGRVRRC